jgi:2-polyprenyl-6-methoxyphenol hydroxylase-like FAD-dependent oxidoreductase
LLELLEDEYKNLWMAPEIFVVLERMPGQRCELTVVLGGARYSYLDIKERLSHFEPRILRLLSELHESDTLTIRKVEHLPTWRSVSGRILLIGDAAHAMGPQLGQVSKGFDDSAR